MFYQALQVVEGDPLHVEAVLCKCEADVPKAETIVAGEHLIWYGLLALNEFQEALKLYLGHLQSEVEC